MWCDKYVFAYRTCSFNVSQQRKWSIMPRKQKRTKMSDVTIVEDDYGITIIGRIANVFSIFSTKGNHGDDVITPSPRAAKSLYKRVVKDGKKGKKVIHSGKPNRG